MINSKILVIGIIQISIFVGLLLTASASGNDLSELKELIFTYEDPKITVQDLAFYLVTHNYDAMPKGDYVEMNLNGILYKLIPNSNRPGLCDILPAQKS